MTIPASGDIKKTDIINEFTTDVINVANAASVYNLSNNPFTNAGYAAYANPHLSNTPASAPVSGDFVNSVSASDIASVLRNYAYNASRIRDVLYQYNNFGTPVTWGQGVSTMNDGYRQGSLLSAGTPPTAGTDVAGGGGGALDTFIGQLASALASARGNTISLLACHSSCHVSCHGARGRR